MSTEIYGTKFGNLARYGAIFVTIVGVTVVFAWVADIEWLKSLVPGAVTMRLNTSVGFIMAGVLVLSLRSEKTLSTILAFLIGLLGILTLGEYAFHTDLHIDNLLIADTVASPYPGRMSPATAFAFVLIACSALALGAKKNALSVITASIASILGFLACIGYLVGATNAYTIGPYTSMAAHTALLFVVLSLSLLALNEGYGFVRTLASDLSGGMLARVLLPLIIIVPTTLVWMILRGHTAGWYGWEFAIAVITTVNTLLTVAFILFASKRLNLLEGSRNAEIFELQQKIVADNEKLKALTGSMTSSEKDDKSALQDEVASQSEHIALLETLLKKRMGD